MTARSISSLSSIYSQNIAEQSPMHISLVSSPIKETSCFKLLQNLTDTTIHKITSVEFLIDRKIPVDFIFFDAEFGERNILQQVQAYHLQYKQMKWIVINLYDVRQQIKYIQAGASGVLTSPCDIEKLQNSIQSVIEGQLFLEDKLIQVLAFRQIKRLLHPFSQITAREFDVFCLLAENYSIQTIAEVLFITTKTAFNCQTQLRKKLDIKNQQQLIILANNYSLIF